MEGARGPTLLLAGLRASSHCGALSLGCGYTSDNAERFLVGHLIFYGLFMMLVIRYLPEGIWGGARRAWAKRP